MLKPRSDPILGALRLPAGTAAHDAVCAVQRFIQEGRCWVADVDLEMSFDRVNHDAPMGRLAKRTADRRVLGLIRRYLEAGIMANGVVMERYEGTPAACQPPAHKGVNPPPHIRCVVRPDKTQGRLLARLGLELPARLRILPKLISREANM